MNVEDNHVRVHAKAGRRLQVGNLQFERLTQKTLQYRKNSRVHVREWVEPDGSPGDFRELAQRARACVFDGKPVPIKTVGKLLSDRCRQLLGLTREDNDSTVWRLFLASERVGTGFDEQNCRRIDDTLFVGFSSVVYALSLEDGKFRWGLHLPDTRFQGLRVPKEKTALIVHGTIGLFRISLEGRVEWETFGASDFGGDLRLCKDVIEIRDVDRNIYLVDYRTGDFAIRPPPLAERAGTVADPEP